jgi:hypothetical protein
MSVHENIPKGGSIECPTVRYLYYVIANTLQARGEFIRVNEEDIIILDKVAIPNCNMTPNLGVMLLLYLDHQDHQTRAPIICRGVITILTNALQVDIGNLHPLEGERWVGF